MKLRKILIGGIAGLLLLTAGCKEKRTEYSSIKTENALVSKNYVPSHSHLRINTNPDVGTTVSRRRHPEEYNVQFKGKAKFELDNKEMFDKFNEGENVRVQYKEVYRAVYDDKNKDGAKELLERKLEGYEFVGAEK